MKELTYLFGVSGYAACSVLTAFMGGLAVGSWHYGKKKKFLLRPFSAYGWLELCIGIAGITSFYLLKKFIQIYPFFCTHFGNNLSVFGLNFFRFVLSIPLAGLPAFFMGGTFPVFSEALGKLGGSFRSRIAFAYSINTLGGAAGTLSGAYYLFYHFGLVKTTLAAALLNGVVFITALWLQKRISTSYESRASLINDTPVISRPRSGREICFKSRFLTSFGMTLNIYETTFGMGVSFLTGLISFVYEIVWFHLLGAIIGNTVYAFSIMLFSFLAAIALSGYLSGLVLKRDRLLKFFLFGSQFFGGCFALITLPLWDRLGGIFMWIGSKHPSFFGMELTRLSISFLLLFIPGFFVALTFPLLFGLIDNQKIPETMGKLYGLNTLGAIIGIFTGSFVLIPGLGSQLSLEVIAFLQILLSYALLLHLYSLQSTLRLGLLLFGISLFAGLFKAIPIWNKESLTSGNYVYFDNSNQRGRVVYWHEDVLGGITTVLQEGGGRTLMTNGKFQGNDSGEEIPQENFVRIPALFVRSFSKAFVVGVGTGHSLQVALEYPFRNVDVAEISPGILKAASLYFQSINKNALKDPRVTVHLEDGRNFLLCSREKYDLITMELSSIWIAGSSNLYNQEYYELCKNHLTQEGVFQQWIQVHHITLADVARSLRTIKSVFPHVVFFVSGGQGIVAASMSPLQINMDYILSKLSAEKRNLQLLPLGDLYLDEKAVESFLNDTAKVTAGPLVSRDDAPILEYSTPYGSSLGNESWEKNLKVIAAYGQGTSPPEASGISAKSGRKLLLAYFYRLRNPALAKKYFTESSRLLEGR